MPRLEDLVAEVQNRWLIGSTAKCIYGTTPAGQRFAILITQGVWYALRLIMDDEYSQYPRPSSWTDWSEPAWTGPNWIIMNQALTWDGILGKADAYKSQLEQGRYINIYENLSPVDRLPARRVMPADCATNPDKYLKPGDLLQTSFTWNTSHEAIYIGDGKVIHVSGHGGGKSESVARVGNLLGDFVTTPDNGGSPNIRVIVMRIRFQTPEQIIKVATDWAEERFRAGEYNLITKNCQHFARLCVIGREESGDIRKLLDHVVSAGIFGVGWLIVLL